MIVADSSPLIALTQINLIWLLPALFADVLIPPAVARETVRSVPRHPWLHERRLSRALDERIIVAALGAGESEVLSLAVELGGAMTLLDDRDARRLAVDLEVPMTGTLGVLLEARRRGTLPALRPHFEALLDVRFFFSPELMEQLLGEVGEA